MQDAIRWVVGPVPPRWSVTLATLECDVGGVSNETSPCFPNSQGSQPEADFLQLEDVFLFMASHGFFLILITSET